MDNFHQFFNVNIGQNNTFCQNDQQIVGIVKIVKKLSKFSINVKIVQNFQNISKLSNGKKSQNCQKL